MTHHCRKCGKAVCEKCSKKRSTLPPMGYEYEVRVCDDCFQKITDTECAPLATFHDAKHAVIHMHLEETRKRLLTVGKDRVIKVGAYFQKSPCEHCNCGPGGHIVCAIEDCYTPCADSVHDPTKCCHECPNGHNCQHKDGTIIKDGETYRPDSMTTCRCPDNHGFGFGGALAVCAHTAPFVQPGNRNGQA